MSDLEFRDERRNKLKEDSVHTKARKSNGDGPKKRKIDPYDRSSRHNVHQELDRYKYVDLEELEYE